MKPAKRISIEDLKQSKNPEIVRLSKFDGVSADPFGVAESIILSALDSKGLYEAGAIRGIKFKSDQRKIKEKNAEYLQIEYSDIAIQDVYTDATITTPVPGQLVVRFKVNKFQHPEDPEYRETSYCLQSLEATSYILDRMCFASSEDETAITLDEVEQSFNVSMKLKQQLDNLKQLEDIKPRFFFMSSKKIYEHDQLVSLMLVNIQKAIEYVDLLKISDKEKLNYYQNIYTSLLGLHDLAKEDSLKVKVGQLDGRMSDLIANLGVGQEYTRSSSNSPKSMVEPVSLSDFSDPGLR